MSAHRITVEAANADLDEYELALRSTDDHLVAARRCGMSHRTLARRYALTGRPLPPGFSWAERKRYPDRRKGYVPA